jgi:hypothetical protein
MATEPTPAGPTRPRPWLLIALAVVVALAAAVWLWPAANPAGPARRASNARAQAAQDMALDPAALDVRLEALEARNGGGPEGGRNPFRFQPKAPPPAPAAPPPDIRPVPPRPFDSEPTGPPPPPPIPLRFIGTVEPPTTPGDKVAVFSDCKITTHAREGAVVLGQYRLVRIGVESVVMEYVDGRGRTTIGLQGGDCVGK